MTSEFSSITIEEATERLIDYRGKTPPKTSDGVRLITAKVIKGGQILDEPSEFIAADYYDEWMRRGLPKRWDVLITTEAPLGEVAILKTDDKVALAQRVILLRAKAECVDAGYLFFALQSEFAQGELRARGSGTTVLGIKQSELRRARIPHFPIEQQRRIASILSAYDDLIENCQRRVRILEEMARSLYREWFVDFRFPGADGLPPRVDSLLGAIPQGWEVKRLGEVLELNYGKALKKEDRLGGSVPVFASSGVVGFHDAALARGPGLIVGRKGNVGSIYWSETDFFVIDTAYYVTARLPLRFLFYDLQTKNFINNDSAVPGLSRHQAYALDTFVPPMNLLARFCELADSFEAQAAALARRITNLRRTRDLLLPRLMSGQIDLRTAEAGTAAP